MSSVAPIQSTPTSNSKVAVIGAGISGLTTAYRLHQRQMDVQVFEARNRVGGRIFSAYVGGQVCELGGQSILDGGDALCMSKLAQELGLEQTEAIPYPTQYYMHNDEAIPIQKYLRNQKHFTQDNLKSQLAAAAQNANNMQQVLDKLFNPIDPTYKILRMFLAGFDGAPPEKLSTLYTKTIDILLSQGFPTVQQTDHEGFMHASIKGGNSLLPKRMAEALDERMHINMPLGAVSKTSTGYQLTFKNGMQHHADILVLAMPCSVYRNIDFGPGVIPAETLTAIQNVQYGTNAKILVPLTCNSNKEAIYMNDRIGTFFNEDGDVLTLYYTGQNGFFDAQTIKERYSQEFDLLTRAYTKECLPTQLPVIARDELFVSYGEPVGFSWPNDPYARGSYSIIAPGQETVLTEQQTINGEQVKKLFAPIDGSLYFAGEHSSTAVDIAGTMEAACESGEKAARMIVKSATT